MARETIEKYLPRIRTMMTTILPEVTDEFMGLSTDDFIRQFKVNILPFSYNPDVLIEGMCVQYNVTLTEVERERFKKLISVLSKLVANL